MYALQFLVTVAIILTLIRSLSDPTELNQVAKCLDSVSHYTLDNVSPHKRKIIRWKKLPPWFNTHPKTDHPEL